MIIIKEPNNHKETSGNVTIIEEVLQSWSEGSGSVFAPGRFGPWHFGQDVSPSDNLDRTFRPLTFLTWTFNPMTLTFRYRTMSFRQMTFFGQEVSLPVFLDQYVSPLDILDLDVLPPEILDQDVSPRTFWTWTFLIQDVSPLDIFLSGRFGPGRFAPNIFDQDVSPQIIDLLYKIYISVESSVI